MYVWKKWSTFGNRLVTKADQLFCLLCYKFNQNQFVYSGVNVDENFWKKQFFDITSALFSIKKWSHKFAIILLH